jgi:triosephosphate isomerase
MQKKTKLLVMNWKCHPSSPENARTLALASDDPRVVVCPPAPFITIVSSVLNKASLGAQDGYWSEGAYTGEYSLSQLKSVRVKYVILGHSERRGVFSETSTDVAKKSRSAINLGITPIICVGERKRTSMAEAKKAVLNQMESSLAGIPKTKAGRIVLAYEPVWAISSTVGGRDTKLSEVEPIMLAMAERFQKLFKTKAKVLYGGSVDPKDIATYIDSPCTHGVLIGGASLSPQKVSKMIKLVSAK